MEASYRAKRTGREWVRKRIPERGYVCFTDFGATIHNEDAPLISSQPGLKRVLTNSSYTACQTVHAIKIIDRNMTAIIPSINSCVMGPTSKLQVATLQETRKGQYCSVHGTNEFSEFVRRNIEFHCHEKIRQSVHGRQTFPT